MSALTEKDAGNKSVGIWIRVSTEDQARGESPVHHEKRARAYAEAKGWNVKELYDLSGVSGKTVIEHPEAKRMLDDIENGHITGLIFSKLARLARSTRELLDFADMFRDFGADLISLQESIDTTSPAGRLFYTLIAAMAQWEREEISERVAASVPIRAQLGKPTGGQASFGYQWKDKKLIPEPNEAPVRKLMYELYLEHRRKKTVAGILNERGYRTRKGAKFSDTTLVRLLRDPTAKGVRRANYTRTTDSSRSWELKPESEWVFTEVEPVVSEELWERVNHLLDEQRKSHKKPTKRPVQLFGGLTYCGCGQKMYVPSNSPKYICKACRNKIPVDDLEAVFVEQLKQFFFSPDEIEKHLQQSDENMVGKQELIVTREAQLQTLKQEMDRLYRLYIDDEIPSRGFGDRYRPLDERRVQIEDEIPRLRAELDVMRINRISSEEVVAEAQDLYSRWPELAHNDRRQIVEAITEQVVIGTDDVEIHLAYLPNPSVDRDGLATNSQGFMAATSCTRAG